MDELETTNPVEGTDVPEAEVETEVHTEPQLDADGNPIEDNAEPEEEEVDLDDLKLKLPKEQAEKLRLAAMRQADYSRKTQALADERKAFEAERTVHQQASAEEQTAQAQIHVLDAQIAQYEGVNWQQLMLEAQATDAANFDQAQQSRVNAAYMQFTMLQNARGEAGQSLTKLQTERQSKEQQETAKRREQGQAELTKHIKDWSPETAAKLMSAGQQHYGFTPEELHAVDDPRIVRALHDAAQWRAHQAKTTKAQAIQKQQEITPAAKPGRASAPPQGLDDRLSIDEWNKRREAQVRARA